MHSGTIPRMGDQATRHDATASGLATEEGSSSRRSTVMCARPQTTEATTEYQSDSSSKRPLWSVVLAARPPTDTAPGRRLTTVIPYQPVAQLSHFTALTSPCPNGAISGSVIGSLPPIEISPASAFAAARSFASANS